MQTLHEILAITARSELRTQFAYQKSNNVYERILKM